VTLILLPLLITFLVHIRIIIDAKKFMSQPSFKPNAMYKSDFSLVRSNFYSFLTFVLFWLPFGTVFARFFTWHPGWVYQNRAFITSFIASQIVTSEMHTSICSTIVAAKPQCRPHEDDNRTSLDPIFVFIFYPLIICTHIIVHNVQHTVINAIVMNYDLKFSSKHISNTCIHTS
jgi:hypothetical protein